MNKNIVVYCGVRSSLVRSCNVLFCDVMQIIMKEKGLTYDRVKYGRVGCSMVLSGFVGYSGVWYCPGT